MASYEFLAGCYDELTTDVKYAQWADYLEKHFARAGIRIHTVLDLACGTGSLTWELARRGYEMIGVDRSEEMLAQANEKGAEQEAAERPMFLHQSMDRLDLYGTIDACVCCLDSVNYVTSPQKLQKAFQRVHLFLMPGGLFLFDVIRRKSWRRWMDRSFWTRRRTPTASGGQSTPGGAESAPIIWISSSWTPPPGSAAGDRAASGAGLYAGGAHRLSASGRLSGH